MKNWKKLKKVTIATENQEYWLMQKVDWWRQRKTIDEESKSIVKGEWHKMSYEKDSGLTLGFDDACMDILTDKPRCHFHDWKTV